jgi:hypothetical protein
MLSDRAAIAEEGAIGILIRGFRGQLAFYSRIAGKTGNSVEGLFLPNIRRSYRP